MLKVNSFLAYIMGAASAGLVATAWQPHTPPAPAPMTTMLTVYPYGVVSSGSCIVTIGGPATVEEFCDDTELIAGLVAAGVDFSPRQIPKPTIRNISIQDY